MPKQIISLRHQMMTQGKTEAEIKLYGAVVEDGPEWWKWSQEDKSANDFDKDIAKLKDAGVKKLLLRINSPGGVVTEAAAMRATLITAGFDEINVRIEGLCASAATALATIPKAHVSISSGGEYMIHNPWVMAMGNANELEREVQHLRANEQTYREMYAKRTGQSEETIKAWMDDETWFSAKKAVEYGFADEIIPEDGEAPAKAVACVSRPMMAAMRDLYSKIPEDVTESGEEQPDEGNDNGSPASSVAEDATVHTNNKEEAKNMNELNQEQLAAIRDEAIKAERQRVQDIHDLTMPGYEAMAEKAISDGTSAMDFQKQIVAAHRAKGDKYLDDRKAELEASTKVKGGAPAEETRDEDEVTNWVNDIVAYAKANANNANGMF